MKRPYVAINCAMSADGKIALPNKKQIRISSEEDIKRVYELRNEFDAVLVGIGTILSDDPKLTVKEKYVKNPKNPLRIVLDTEFRTPKEAHVLNEFAETLIFSSKKQEFDKKNVKVIKCDKNADGEMDIGFVLDYLHKKGVKKLLVEGGSKVIWNFLRNKFVDDLYIYIGPMIIGGRDTPTVAGGLGIKNKDVIKLKLLEAKILGEGILTHYRLIK